MSPAMSPALVCHVTLDLADPSASALHPSAAWLCSAGIRAITCDAAHMATIKTLADEHGLIIWGVSAQVDLRRDEPTDELLAAMTNAAPGTHLLLQLISNDTSDQPSAPRANAPAAAAVTRLATTAARQGIALLLDPRAGQWMQRIEDCVRVAMRVSQSQVGIIFSLGDWHQTDGDPALLPERLKLAMPRLKAVALSIAMEPAGQWRPVAHDGSPVDAQPMMKLLKQLGFTGPLLLRP